MFLSRRSFHYIAIVTVVLVATISVNFAISKNKNEISKKVVLITIDGLKPDFYLDEKYKAPTLKQLRDMGSYAEGVEVVFPSLTYPSHATLITGAYPAQHGILSNTLFSWEGGPSPAWFWEADKIKVPTLFEYVQKAGGVTASVRWPVTLFEKNVDYLVPEIFDMKGFYEGGDFELTIKYTKPELAKEILSYTTLKRYDNEVEMDNWSAEAAAYIIKNKKPDFMALHLANVDHVEHGFGPSSNETTQAVAEVDKQIKIVMDAIDTKSTCVIITGDHGFFDITKRVSPNVLFVEKGWITLNNDGSLKDWQVIAQSGGGQAAIYFKNKKLIPEVTKVLNENASQGFVVLSKNEINKWGAYPEADLAIEGKPGYTVSGSYKGALISDSTNLKGNHGFLPTHPELHTGLITVGCGYPKGQHWGIVHSIDIAPTITEIMGIPSAKFVGRPLN